MRGRLLLVLEALTEGTHRADVRLRRPGGFTALTEERGDDHAADTALAFCAHLNTLLPEGAEDLKMLDDACLIRVPRADATIELGLQLTRRRPRHEPQLDVRVGMHTGTAVQRGADWFGSALNIAARVVAEARGGEVLLTDATRKAAGAATAVSFENRGRHRLRGLKDELQLHAAVRRPA